MIRFIADHCFDEDILRGVLRKRSARYSVMSVVMEISLDVIGTPRTGQCDLTENG